MLNICHPNHSFNIAMCISVCIFYLVVEALHLLLCPAERIPCVRSRLNLSCRFPLRVGTLDLMSKSMEIRLRLGRATPNSCCNSVAFFFHSLFLWCSKNDNLAGLLWLANDAMVLIGQKSFTHMQVQALTLTESISLGPLNSDQCSQFTWLWVCTVLLHGTLVARMNSGHFWICGCRSDRQVVVLCDSSYYRAASPRKKIQSACLSYRQCMAVLCLEWNEGVSFLF